MKWIFRVFVFVLGLILLAAGVLLAMGSRPGANMLSVRVEINKPPEAVWKYVADPATPKEWVSWLVEVRQLTPGAQPVGSKEVWVMEDRNNGNARMEILSETTRFEPHRRMDVRLSSPGEFSGEVAYLFEDLGGGRTALTQEGTYLFESWFARLMAPVVMPSARSKLVGDIERLKANVEKLP